MKIKNIVTLSLVVFILASCAPTKKVVPTETAVPTWTFTFTPVPPQPTTTSIPPVETMPMTQKSVSQFASSMQSAGINITAEQILQQKLEIQTVTGADGKKYEIASTVLDPDPNQRGEVLEGSYPLMIKTETGWAEATLKDLAHIKGMQFGAALNLNKDFYSITIDNFETGNAYIDWNLIQAQKGVWNFSDPDYNITTAHSNGMPIMANLIWARNVPDWAKQDPDLQAVMVDYITQVMTHYQGKVDSWNVYNEAHRIKDEDDVFWRKLGIQGVRDAYSTARIVDPHAKLLYSDFLDLEGYTNVHYPPIIDTIVTQLQLDGNIDGISLQVTGRVKRLDMEKLKAGLDSLKIYNLPIHISEFSILIEGENTPENLREQAKAGADIIRILKQHNVVEVIAFGLEDRLTNKIYNLDNANAGFWLKKDSGSYIPKPMVYTMMAVLAEP
jgi:GH35 family endo-1,4-beta-xylanase